MRVGKSLGSRTHVLSAPGLPLTLLHGILRTNSFFVFMELSYAQPQEPRLAKILPISLGSKRWSPVFRAARQAVAFF